MIAKKKKYLLEVLSITNSLYNALYRGFLTQLDMRAIVYILGGLSLNEVGRSLNEIVAFFNYERGESLWEKHNFFFF